MIRIVIIVLIVPLLSFFNKINNDSLKGTWQLNQVTLNMDTIFYRGKFEYTLNHNFELSKDWIKSKEDSLIVEEKAKMGFQNSMRMTIEFLNDSEFNMTRVRSGGRVYDDEIDRGTYELRSDTLIMTNHSRNNYEMMFIVDFQNEKFFQKDGNSNQKFYQEYLKKHH